MPTLQAKDLTREFPRSPYEELGGYPWLARMIDKVRSLTAGTLGEYTPYPCGGDQRFLGTLGVDPEALKALIAGGASDAEVVEWVKANVTPGVEGRLAEYRAAQHQPVAPGLVEYLEGSKAEYLKANPGADLSGIVNFAQMICTEEGHEIPKG